MGARDLDGMCHGTSISGSSTIMIPLHLLACCTTNHVKSGHYVFFTFKKKGKVSSLQIICESRNLRRMGSAFKALLISIQNWFMLSDAYTLRNHCRRMIQVVLLHIVTGHTNALLKQFHPCVEPTPMLQSFSSLHNKRMCFR